MDKEIKVYNERQIKVDKEITNLLAQTIDSELTEAESKIWHTHSVWFLDDNPDKNIVKRKGQLERLK